MAHTTIKETALRNARGMTLIDMAIFLLVIGLITAPLIKAYDAWSMFKASGETENNLGAINKAMADFYYENNTYPCPAVINLPPTDPAYGVEDCTINTTTGSIRNGGVPFSSLKIPPETALDGWKNRIQYSISTMISRQAGTFPSGTVSTGISALRWKSDFDGGGYNTPVTDVHYVLISHGRNGIGGYSANGNLVQSCITDASATRESENCNNDMVFFDDENTHNDTGLDYLDDYLEVVDRVPNRIWVNSTAPIKDPTDIVTGNAQIGVNIVDPFSSLPNPLDDDTVGVEVAGNIRAGDATSVGQVVTDKMCDENGENCFDPKLIGGAPTAFNDCSTNAIVSGDKKTGMRGLWNGDDPEDGRNGKARTRCQNTYLKDVATLCTEPQYAIGFSGGKILCGP